MVLLALTPMIRLLVIKWGNKAIPRRRAIAEKKSVRLVYDTDITDQ